MYIKAKIFSFSFKSIFISYSLKGSPSTLGLAAPTLLPAPLPSSVKKRNPDKEHYERTFPQKVINRWEKILKKATFKSKCFVLIFSLSAAELLLGLTSLATQVKTN